VCATLLEGVGVQALGACALHCATFQNNCRCRRQDLQILAKFCCSSQKLMSRYCLLAEDDVQYDIMKFEAESVHFLLIFVRLKIF